MTATRTFPLPLSPAGSGVAPGWLRLLGLGLLLTAPFWFTFLFTASPDLLPPGSAYLLIPMLVALQGALVFLASSADRYLRQVMFIAALAKLCAASAFLYMVVKIYVFDVDTVHYFYMGTIYAQDVAWNHRWELLHPFWSNNSIYMLNGALQMLVGRSFQTIAVAFAFLSFWGQYFIYRSFCTSFPDGNQKRAALLIFLLPSIVFWPASIGKEAPILFFIGVTLYAASLLMRQIKPLRLIALAAGLAGCGIVRPHIAAMMAIAFLFGWVLGKDWRGSWGITVKVLTVPILLAGTAYLVSSATRFLEIENVSGGVTLVQQVAQYNSYGGSRFGSASVLQRALGAPLLFFRPFPFEVTNVASGVTSAESLLLLLLTWKERRTLWRLLRHLFFDRAALFLAAYLVIFSIAFSAAITNFGLLARERSTALPLFAMLLCRRGFSTTPKA